MRAPSVAIVRLEPSASALDHILGGKRTIAAEKGLFLEETWRLHPAICAYTS
jgi:hypothetical protein